MKNAPSPDSYEPCYHPRISILPILVPDNVIDVTITATEATFAHNTPNQAFRMLG